MRFYLGDDSRKCKSRSGNESKSGNIGQEKKRGSEVHTDEQGPSSGHWPRSSWDPLRGQAEPQP